MRILSKAVEGPSLVEGSADDLRKHELAMREARRDAANARAEARRAGNFTTTDSLRNVRAYCGKCGQECPSGIRFATTGGRWVGACCAPPEAVLVYPVGDDE